VEETTTKEKRKVEKMDPWRHSYPFEMEKVYSKP
jgi:hypothetical protein